MAVAALPFADSSALAITSPTEAPICPWSVSPWRQPAARPASTTAGKIPLCNPARVDIELLLRCESEPRAPNIGECWRAIEARFMVWGRTGHFAPPAPPDRPRRRRKPKDHLHLQVLSVTLASPASLVAADRCHPSEPTVSARPAGASKRT